MQINFKGNRSNGIIQYFFDTYLLQFNDHVKTSSPTHQFSPNNVIDKNKESYWYGSQIVVYFPHHYIDINSYMIQTSYGSSISTCYPWKWSLEASNDNSNWFHKEEVIDDEGHIRSAYGSVVNPWNHGPYKYFRLQTDASVCGENYGMDISEIEFFGTLYSSYPIKSCRKQFSFLQKHIFLLIYTGMSEK